MSLRPTVLALVLISFFVAAAIETADAQILERARQRAAQRIQEQLEKRADDAVDKALDRAEAAADSAAARVVGDGSGASGGTGSPGGLLNLGAAVGGQTAETVPFADLRALLPERISGMTRTEATGERNAAFGIQMSHAQARFESDQGNVEVKITDMGTLRGLAMLGHAWLAMEVDRESDTGYEKTGRYDGFPSFERVERSDGYLESELTVVVGERFVVAIAGNNVGMDALRAALSQIDLGKLEAMKMHGVKEGGDLVDFRSLQALLPASALGLEGSRSGETGGAFGINVSSAKGEYRSSDGSKYVTATITNANAGLLSIAAWSAIQIDRETDRGHERTTRYEGYPAFEKTERGDDYLRSELQVAVGQRFLVQLEGNVPLSDLQTLLSQIDLKKLETLE